MKQKYNPDLLDFARELRSNMTPEEKHLWYDFLSKYPVRFARQKIIGKYIADFYCAKAKLVIELDGRQHLMPSAKAYDEIRTGYMSDHDLTVIRIPNNRINNDFNFVCRYIDNKIKESLTE